MDSTSAEASSIENRHIGDPDYSILHLCYSKFNILILVYNIIFTSPSVFNNMQWNNDTGYVQAIEQLKMFWEQ